MKPVTTEHLREEIAKLDDKIANLQAERTDLSAYMERKGLPIYRRSVEEIVTDLKKNGAEFKSSGNA